MERNPQIMISKLSLIVLSSILVALLFFTYQRNRYWTDDMALWTDVINKSSQKARGYGNLAKKFRSTKQYDTALKYVNVMILLEPDNATAYCIRADIYYELNRPYEAFNDYNKAIMLEPTTVAALIGRGNIYSAQGKQDQAISDFTYASTLSPDLDFVYFNRGNAYFAKESYKIAIQDYSKAIILNPYYHDAYENRGNAFHKLGQLDMATADYRRADELK